MKPVLIAVAAYLLITNAQASFTMEIIGHRGASHAAPENTLAAVNLAWERGADAVEIDVFLTKDGRIVVIHDANTKKLAGRDRKVIDQTLAELKALDVGRWKGEQWADERIPTLEEVLATVPDGKRLLIEIKSGPEIVPKLKRLIETAGKKPGQTAIIGFSLATVKQVKRELPRLKVYWVVALKRDKVTRKWSPAVESLIRQARAANLDGLDVGRAEVIDRPYVQKVRQAGLGFYVWTVNSIKEARRLKEIGVDGIATDRPGWMRDHLLARWPK